MARPNSRVSSSGAVGTSSGEMKKKKKPIGFRGSIKKKATVKPPKPAPNARKTGFTAADVERMKAELEKVMKDEAAQKEEGEKLKKEQTRKIQKLEKRNQVQETQEITASKKFEVEEEQVIQKNTATVKEGNKFLGKIKLQYALDSTRHLSTHFLKRSETLEREGSNGGARPYQKCELCDAPWTEDGDGVPRILNCGHTMCNRCAQRMKVYGKIKCPFDRKMTLARKVPTNYSLLSM